MRRNKQNGASPAMNSTTDLATTLFDFILDNHSSILLCSSCEHCDLRLDDTESLRTGIEDILAHLLQPPTIQEPPAPPDPAAVVETVLLIWTTVLRGFTDGVWLEQNGQLHFFARWDTLPNESTLDLLTQLITENHRT